MVDALSHRDTEEALLNTIIASTSQLYNDIRHFIATSLDAPSGMTLSMGTGPNHGASIDSLILRAGHIFVLVSSGILQMTLLQLVHTTHNEGTRKTLKCICVDFSINHDRRLIAAYVRTRATCQRDKTEDLHPASLISMDRAEPWHVH